MVDNEMLKRVEENLKKGLGRDMLYALDLMFLWKNRRKYGDLTLSYRAGKIVNDTKLESEKVNDNEPARVFKIEDAKITVNTEGQPKI